MIIYKYTNKINGKQYIGQTIRGFDLRHYEHIRGDKSYFDRAINKYGIENFEWEILYVASNTEELNEKEIELIQKHNTLKPNGYNVTLGGGSFNGYSPSEKTKEKISNGIKAFYKKNPSIYGGENSHQYGRVWTHEERLKMSKIKNRFWDGNEVAKNEMSEIKKSFYRDNPDVLGLLMEGNKRWVSENGGGANKGKEFSQETRTKMRESALRRSPVSEETKKKLSENNPRKRKVINLDTSEIFDTIKLASESVNRNKSSVSNACRWDKGKNVSGGYRWAYLDEYEQFDSTEEYMNNKQDKQRKGKITKSKD